MTVDYISYLHTQKLLQFKVEEIAAKKLTFSSQLSTLAGNIIDDIDDISACSSDEFMQFARKKIIDGLDFYAINSDDYILHFCLTQNSITLDEIERLSFDSMLYGTTTKEQLQQFLQNINTIGISKLKVLDRYHTNSHGELEDSLVYVILGNFDLT